MRNLLEVGPVFSNGRLVRCIWEPEHRYWPKDITLSTLKSDWRNQLIALIVSDGSLRKIWTVRVECKKWGRDTWWRESGAFLGESL